MLAQVTPLDEDKSAVLTLIFNLHGLWRHFCHAHLYVCSVAELCVAVDVRANATAEETCICSTLVSTQTRTYEHAYIHTYIHTYIQTDIHTYTNTYIHTHIPTMT